MITEVKDLLITRIVELMYDGITLDKVMLEILKKEKVISPETTITEFVRFRISNQEVLVTAFAEYRKDFNLKAIVESDLTLRHVRNNGKLEVRVSAANTTLRNIEINGLQGNGDGKRDRPSLAAEKHKLAEAINSIFEKAKKDD